MTVLSVPSSSTFTFAVSSSLASTASGTITAIVEGAGWSMPYSATQTQVWQSTDAMSSQLPFLVNDTNAQYAMITGYISMTSVTAGTENWFTGYIKKSSTSDTTPRPWIAVADDKTLHLFIGWNQTIGATPMYSHYVIGDLFSYVPGDIYGGMLCAHSINSPASLGVDVGTLACGNIGSTLSTNAGVVVARSLYGSAGSARFLRAISMAGGLSTSNTASGADNNSFIGTQYADNGLHFVPVLLSETDSVASKFPIRGESRGHFHILEQNPAVGVNGYSSFAGPFNMISSTLLLIRTGAGSNLTECREAIDITGPWK